MIRLICLLSLLFALQNTQAQSYRQDNRFDFKQGVSAAQKGNYAQAYCIWKPLADVGHAEAQYRLGWLYAKGLGLAVDEKIAIYWWKQAADLGHADALFSLGWAYEHGDGIPKDIPQAISYYLKAATHGQEDAIELLQLMLMRNNKEVAKGVGQILQKDPGRLGTMSSISVAKANIRNAANKNAKLLGTLKKDDAIVVLGNKGNWLRIWIVSQQRLGWIYNRLVSGYNK